MRYLSSLYLLALCMMISAQAESVEIESSAAASLGYDSNVTVDEIDVNSSVGDHFRKMELEFKVLSEWDSPHNFRASMKYSKKDFFDLDAFNISSVFLSTGYRYKRNKVTYGADVRYVDSGLGGDEFLRLTQFSPFVSGFVSKNQYVRVSYVHSEKRVINSPARKASSRTFGGDYYYFISGLKQFIVLGYKYKEEHAVSNQFDFDSHRIRAGYEKKFELLGLPAEFNANFRLREREYNDYLGPTGNKRMDERRKYELSVLFNLTSDLSLAIEGARIVNESTVDSLSYQENNYFITINYDF